jgi:hypothetical protein
MRITKMATSAINSNCNCGKKSFATEAEAVAAEIEQREQHHFNRQYSYQCGAGNWHLTSKVPGSFKQPSSGHKLAQAANLVPVIRTGPGRRSMEEIQERRVVVTQYHKDGKTAQEISALIGIGVSAIESDLQSQGVQPNGKRVYTKHAVSVAHKPVLTLSSINTEEEALVARLAQVRADKQRLLEAAALKVTLWNNEGVLIQKQGSSLGISWDDASSLVDKITALFAARS